MFGKEVGHVTFDHGTLWQGSYFSLALPCQHLEADCVRSVPPPFAGTGGAWLMILTDGSGA